MRKEGERTMQGSGVEMVMLLTSVFVEVHVLLSLSLPNGSLNP